MENPKICKDCCYRKASRCTKADLMIRSVETCPEGISYELITEITKDYKKRLRGISTGMTLRKEW